MAHLALTPPRHRTLRLLAFAIETHPPAVYALVSWGWAYSLMGLLAGGTTLPPQAPWVGAVFFLILLYLRAIDEIKDLPYDRVHHPGRPLVRGAVQGPEVAGFAAGVAAVVVGLSAFLSPWLALWAALQLAYGLGLLVLERRWQRMRESILLNLVITFPVSAALNGYVLLFLITQGVAPRHAGPVVLAHVAVFLHMEFGRKLKWPQWAGPGEHSYATALGGRGAAAVCVGLGLIACALASHTHALHGAGLWAALPWLAAVPSAVGLRLFWRDRHLGQLGHGAQPRELKPWFGAAMLLFFGLNAGVGLM